MAHRSEVETRITGNSLAGRRYYTLKAALLTELGPAPSAFALEQLARALMLLVTAEGMRLRAMEGKSVNMTQLLQLESAADRVLASVRNKPKKKRTDAP